MNLKTLPALRSAIAAVAAIAALPIVVQAQPTAHYPAGVEGIKAATLPPPGVYFRDYNVGYYANRINDSHGHEISAADPELWLYANVPRVIWITDFKVLGGYIGVDALVPIQYTDLLVHTPAGPFKDSAFGVGDVFGEVTWSTHMKQLDLSAAYGIWAPTGSRSDAGLGYWTHMFTAGATWYPDAEKKWALSALNRYEINTEQRNTEVTVGDAWTLEGGLSRAVSSTVDVGVVGYYQMQVTADRGAETSGRDKVAAIGPEVSVFYPRITFGWSLRYLYEFLAENRLQGHTFALTMTKRF